MKNSKWIFILVNLLLLLAYITYAVYEKEALLKRGRLVLLELAPVDPRSLMQGDYMELRYAISRNDIIKNLPKRGYCVVKIDSNGVGNHARFQNTPKPVNQTEQLIKYHRSNDWTIFIGAESYFFQEGHAKKYDSAKYGGIVCDEEGNSLLVALYDSKLRKLQ